MYTSNVYEWPYYIFIQRLLLTFNGLNIMITLGVYFVIILSFYTRYLLNILRPYYKFIQAILLYFLKLLQTTIIIIVVIIMLYKIFSLLTL